MNSLIFQEILDKIGRGESAEMSIVSGDKEYIRRFLSSDRLIILGGGHVGFALCQMASLLNFAVTIVDDRPAFANCGRFPQAKAVICDSFESAIHSLNIRSTDYVCVLTRGHRWDQLCVETILSGEMPYYFGMIGSRRRVAGMKDTLKEKGCDPERLEMLHAPIGLSIGAQTPMEIALSICAEMIRHKRSSAERLPDNVLFSTYTDVDVLRHLADSDTPRALLVVLSSDGSTPVESGAMMAVDATGSTFGTIGGGCSEAAAVSKARRIIGTGKSAVIDFDMSNEVAEENGMVCGGSMTVLIEDIEP